MKLRNLLIPALLFSALSCTEKLIPDVTDPEIPTEPETEQEIVWDEGVKYIWDESVIPEITIEVSVEQWNNLLKAYDKNQHTEEYVHCNVRYRKGSEETYIEDAGLRLRGNTSRVRPEGNHGQMHQTDNTDWRKCHFGLNFRKFVKDDKHEIKGVRKLHLKWFKEDPSHVRELFCYDLFRRAGIWTALQDVYCRVWVHVEGDSKPAYYGVYNMLERADNHYVKRRVAKFGSDEGNLWKCVVGADFKSIDAGKIGPDDPDRDYPYELKENEGTFEEAAAQLKNFILNVSQLNDEDFYKWIQRVCDVELLLKTYAVNVAVGMWDDHWNNSNNFYIYFNSNSTKDYKFFFIPYDYDNTLGTSHVCGAQTDSGRHDPYKWGNQGILIERLMKFDDFRKIYRNELLRVTNPANGLMDYEAATARIKAWHDRIREYVYNDTGDGMEIKDRPASWGNHHEYRLLDPDPDVNFFKVKAETIRNMK